MELVEILLTLLSFGELTVYVGIAIFLIILFVIDRFVIGIKDLIRSKFFRKVLIGSGLFREKKDGRA